MIYISNKKFFLNSFFSSLPGFISILLSLLSIPIYLKYGGAEEYGSYIFLHFLGFVGQIFNLGLGKISTIIIAQNKGVDDCSWILLKKTIKNSLLIFLVLSIFFIINKFFLFSSSYILLVSTLSIVITIIFVTIEGVFQGKKLFVKLMLINLLFYGVSLSFPPFLLIFYYASYKTIFFISLIIKIAVIIISIFYLFRKKPLNFFFKKKPELNYNFDQKWFSISSILSIAYDFADKYLIKIFIGPIALAFYSIPQQLTGKLSIISKGISAVLLPYIAFSGGQKLSKDLLLSLKIFMFAIPVLIFFLFNFFDIFFSFWLHSNSNIQIVNLAKIFSIIAWISCMSHLIISYFEGSGIIKKNAIIELKFYPFFLFFLLIAILNKNLFIIAIVILLKEIFLFFFRSIFLSKKFNLIKYSYPIIAIACCYLFYSIEFDLMELFRNE
jgi:O-antigen/teichoic acid export membrane protein